MVQLTAMTAASAVGRAQDRESSPVKDRRSTAEPCNQPSINQAQMKFSIQAVVGLNGTHDAALKSGSQRLRLRPPCKLGYEIPTDDRNLEICIISCLVTGPPICLSYQ